jgi:twinkle protein|tara:strand:+ start:1950 stop:2903 length:954 start_codon:yes stop_codon:yes gene_type:complete
MIVDRISVGDFDTETLKQVLAEKTQHKVNWIDRYRDKITEEDPSLEGIYLPWSKTFEPEPRLVLQYGAVSLWVGIDGHKKTSVLAQIAAFAARETVVGIASFEMNIRSQITLLTQMSRGNKDASAELENEFLTWGEGKILLYDHVGDVPAIEAFALVVKMARDYGAKLIVIDCLQMIGGVGEKTEVEREIMKTFVQLAKAFDVHIAIVHHTRKPPQGGDEYIPTRFDVLGSSSYSQLASILCVIWADKKKDKLRAIENSGQELDEAQIEYMKRPDLRLICSKNRHLPWEGTIGLWLHNRQFIASDQSQRLFFSDELK